ncbi:hypothetical protein J2125_003611 [Erwinia toletana]|uniref:Uncharacterized protein n=1 Tax=Winslowiella toletana TaxID=92490 RepID=A0ABS4PCR3_9GAMM|nr:hypothetical protein [Winslowiella toletana]MBP2170419.1 hypothetical protein [Winslowiella toletana]
MKTENPSGQINNIPQLDKIYKHEHSLKNIVNIKKITNINIKTDTKVKSNSKNNEAEVKIPKFIFDHNVVIGPTTDNKKWALGKKPAFYLNQGQQQTIYRQEINPTKDKAYTGINRVSQILRHIATAIHDKMNVELKTNPIEVQVSVFGEKIHISANYNTDKIEQALYLSLNDETSQPDIKRPVDKNDWFQVSASRNYRHQIKLRAFLSTEKLILTLVRMEKEIDSILNGKSVGDYQKMLNAGLSITDIKKQCKHMVNVLFKVLSEAKKNNFNNIMIHAPVHDDNLAKYLSKRITQTRHAEQNIENFLAENKDEIYKNHNKNKASKPIIIPIDGKFVACGTCHELETMLQQEGSGGLFDPHINQFTLYRSSQRIGMVFAGEIQHLALNALAPGNDEKAIERGIELRTRFTEKPEELQAFSSKVFPGNSFNTSSEDEIESP